jgi:hypothetical protein
MHGQPHIRYIQISGSKIKYSFYARQKLLVASSHKNVIILICGSEFISPGKVEQYERRRSNSVKARTQFVIKNVSRNSNITDRNRGKLV